MSKNSPILGIALFVSGLSVSLAVTAEEKLSECEELVKLTDKILDARAEAGMDLYYDDVMWRFVRQTIHGVLEDWGWGENAARLGSQEWFEALWFESNDLIYVDESRDKFLSTLEQDCESNDGRAVVTMADRLR